MDLSVVIPAINEGENLRRVLPALRDVLDRLGITFEILVMDGGSTDDTIEVANQHQAATRRQKERGFGKALWEGITSTSGEWILTLDADGSHDPAYVPLLWRQRDVADMVIASRYAPCGFAECPWARGVMSRFLNWTARVVCSIPLRDLSGGFRLYRRRMFEEFSLDGRDFNVLIEAAIKAYAFGFRIVEVPFHFKQRRGGESHARVLAYGISFALGLYGLWRTRNTVYFADYDERAFRSRLLPQRIWQRRRYKLTRRFMEGSSPALDVGCGSGRMILSNPHAIGMDMDLRKVRFIRTAHAKVVVGSVTHIPFPDEHFEEVICLEVIEHIPDMERPLRELVRVLRPGGSLVLSTPDYGTWVWPLVERVYGWVLPGAYADEHVSHYTKPDLVTRLADLGIEVVASKSMFFANLILKGKKREQNAAGETPGP
ncbi:MAG: glycosyltransferase [Planctomycetota bacterium]|nr:glycosyltransferase [Planctomycetota bacterium]